MPAFRFEMDDVEFFRMVRDYVSKRTSADLVNTETFVLLRSTYGGDGGSDSTDVFSVVGHLSEDCRFAVVVVGTAR